VEGQMGKVGWAGRGMGGGRVGGHEWWRWEGGGGRECDGGDGKGGGGAAGGGGVGWGWRGA